MKYPSQIFRTAALQCVAIAACALAAHAQPNCLPMAYNGPVVAGSITQAAQLDCYRFTGNAGEKVRVNMAWGGIAMFLEILDAAGVTVSSGCNSSQVDATLPGSGLQTFRIRVRDCNSVRTGWYALSLQRLDTNEGGRDLYYTSPPIGGSIGQPALVHRYRFSAQAGKMVQFNTAWGGIAMAVEVLNPLGERVDYFVNQSTYNLTLPATSVYSLHVRDDALVRQGWYQLSLNCVTFPCDGTAVARVYGTGWPGTGQIVPELSASAPPRIGTQIDLRIGNSSGTRDALAAVFLGLRNNPNATLFGGSLMLDPLSIVFVSLPAAGLSVPLPIPNTPDLRDLAIHLQAVQQDGGASHGLSFSRGLTLVFG